MLPGGSRERENEKQEHGPRIKEEGAATAQAAACHSGTRPGLLPAPPQPSAAPAAWQSSEDENKKRRGRKGGGRKS